MQSPFMRFIPLFGLLGLVVSCASCQQEIQSEPSSDDQAENSGKQETPLPDRSQLLTQVISSLLTSETDEIKSRREFFCNENSNVVYLNAFHQDFVTQVDGYEFKHGRGAASGEEPGFISIRLDAYQVDSTGGRISIAIMSDEGPQGGASFEYSVIRDGETWSTEFHLVVDA